MVINEMLFKLRENKYAARLLTPKTLEQFIKYVITGGLSAGVELSLIYALKEFAHLAVVTANTAAYSGGFCISFLLNKYWSFNSKEHFVRQLLMYGVLFAINLSMSDGLMYLLTSTTSIHYMILKLFVMGIIILWNFVIYKKIIYR